MDVTKQSLEEVNWTELENFVKSNLPELSSFSMTVKQFTAGYSNLTYLLSFGDNEMVLRRPPFGYIPPRAHDMEREYRILTKIHPIFPLAPKPLLYQLDPNIMDKHFYIMEKKQGVVLDDQIPDCYAQIANVGEQISTTFVDTLVQLHDIDYQQAGLSELGKPEGYLKRQVEGWIKRYEQSKTDDIQLIDELVPWLLHNIPDSPKTTIVHNDFKLNNMMFSASNPSEVVGIFDWEMCTIGDPLVDLGLAIAYWTEPGDAETGLTTVTNQGGFLSRREILDRYANKSRLDVSNINYYVTFAFFKTAVVLQQLYYRWKIGELQDNRFEKLNVGIYNLLKQAQLTKGNKLL
ncbi:phosphotransferase family protein [Alkalihalophilus pseudofirmus]|nr:phosphotransferase family protein [Alkalihalophilus pseudofirmus]